mgnify:FL=1
MGPKLVVGVGNPGRAYAGTRHNAGWWVLARLADRWRARPRAAGPSAEVREAQVDGAEVWLVWPLTYVNLSGQAVGPLVRRAGARPEVDLLVVVDDVALPPGALRLRPRGSAGGHKGLLSIAAALGTTGFPRLRLGVGRPPPEVDLADWVLSVPPAAERRQIEAAADRAAEIVEVWVREGLERAMNLANTRNDREERSR